MNVETKAVFEEDFVDVLCPKSRRASNGMSFARCLNNMGQALRDNWPQLSQLLDTSRGQARHYRNARIPVLYLHKIKDVGDKWRITYRLSREV